MQLTAWQRKIPRKLSPVSGVVLAVIIVALVLGGSQFVQWFYPGQKITPRTVGNLEEMPTLIRHDEEIWSIAFNPKPNGDVSFVSSSGDGLTKLWHLDKDGVAERFAVQAGREIALSPDGKLLASHDRNSGDAKVWDLTQINKLFRRLQDNQQAYAVSFSRDGQTLASGNSDGTITLWDWQHRKLLHRLKAYEGGVITIAFSPDGQTLASSSEDTAPIKLWNWKTGKVLRTLEEHERIYSLAFSPKGQTLAICNSDGTIDLWDWRNGTKVRSFQDTDSRSGFGFSPDGQTLASVSKHGIQLWNLNDGTKTLTIQEGRSPLAFSPDGQTLASNSDNGTIKLWNRSDGRSIRELQGRENFISSLRFSPDGKTLIGGSYYGAITFWNPEDGTKRLRIGGEKEKAFVREIPSALSPDGQTLAMGSKDKGIQLLSLNYRATLAQPLNVKLKYSLFVAFMLNRQNLILAGSREIKELRLRDRQEMRTLKAEPNKPFIAVALSPDGQTLVSSRFYGSIELWSLRDGKIFRTLQTAIDDNTAWSVAFSPDGQMLASADPVKRTIQVWNWRNGNLMHQWDANIVVQVAFSPDGQLLASGDGYGDVQLWSPQTGKKLRTLKGHASYINALTFSPDGQTLASGSGDQTIKLWRVKQ